MKVYEVMRQDVLNGNRDSLYFNSRRAAERFIATSTLETRFYYSINVWPLYTSKDI